MGRPTTSGYCHTCRKRRIKCGKERPSCNRCLKSGYTCRGYDLGLRMQCLVVATDTTGRQRLAEHKDGNDGGDSGCHGAKGLSLLTTQFAGSPNREISLVAFRDAMAVRCFFSSNKWAGCWKPFIELVYEHGFAAMGHDGVLALAYGHMGMTHGAVDLQVHGQRLYGRSLSQVQLQLDQYDQVDKYQVARIAVPVMLLAMYSFAVDKDLRLIHHLGLKKILQHCEPEAFQEEPLLSVFRSLRSQIICQSLATFETTFLEERPWKTLPFCKTEKTWLDKLLDILVDIPGVIHSMTMSPRPLSSSTKALLYRRVRQLVTELHLWRCDWDCANQGAVWSGPSMFNTQDPSLNEHLSNSLQFSTTSQAVTILMSCAGLIYLMQLETILVGVDSHHGKFITATQHKSLLWPPGDMHSIFQPMIEGLRILPYLHDNLVSGEGGEMVPLFSIGAVYCVLRKQCLMNEKALAVWPFFSESATELGAYEVSTI